MWSKFATCLPLDISIIFTTKRQARRMPLCGELIKYLHNSCCHATRAYGNISARAETEMFLSHNLCSVSRRDVFKVCSQASQERKVEMLKWTCKVRSMNSVPTHSHIWQLISLGNTTYLQFSLRHSASHCLSIMIRQIRISVFPVPSSFS